MANQSHAITQTRVARLALDQHSQQRTTQPWPAQKSLRHIFIGIAMIGVLPYRCLYASQEVPGLQLPPRGESFETSQFCGK